MGGVLTWQLGTLAVGATVPLTFSGVATAPAGTTLLNAVRTVSSTPDPDPANNDGSGDSSRVSTLVLAVPPEPNRPPVADDLVRDTTTGALVGGVVQATDPDVGQELTVTLLSPPSSGVLLLTPAGGFLYASQRTFAGVDTFTFQVCDNASPTPGCDTGTVTLNVRPRARDDVVQTPAGTPVSGPLLANDTAGAPLDPAPVTPPAHGTVVLDPATGGATYTPAPGFVGVDTFEYRICSPSEPSFCDTALVTISVVTPNHPPTVAPLALVTTVGAPVSGVLTTADPDGDALVTASGVPARTGRGEVTPDGTTTYSPRGGFAGRDWYGVIVCDDGTPVLCSSGVVTVEVYPVATADAATTPQGAPVDVAVDANDLGIVSGPVVTAGPSRGSVTFTGAVARYVPEPGFHGTDTFVYTICASTASDLCASATVTITVTAGPVPPTPDPSPSPDPAPAPDPPRPPDEQDVLAVTGADSGPLVALGLVLLAAGTGLVVLRRRRRA